MNATQIIAAKTVLLGGVAGYLYRDADGWPWEPMPGSDPQAGGKVRVRVLDETGGSKRTGVYLNGVITIDPLPPGEMTGMSYSF